MKNISKNTRNTSITYVENKPNVTKEENRLRQLLSQANEKIVQLEEEIRKARGPLKDAFTSSIPTGYVYILANPSYIGIYKIGMTERNPRERLSELSGATGVPTPFEIISIYPCYNAAFLEKKIHKFLEKYRVSTNREFFKVELEVAIKTVSELCENERNEILAGNGLI